MRRALAVFFALLALSAGLLAGAYAAVGPQGGRVEVEGAVLAGGPAGAEGLELAAVRECDDRLFWLTTFPAGAAEEAETLCSFSGGALYTGSAWSEWPPVKVGLDLEGYVDGQNPPQIHRDPDSFQMRLLEALEGQTELRPGDEVLGHLPNGGMFFVRRLPLAEYTDALPLTTDFYPGTVGRELTADFSEYFSFPVPEGLCLEATLRVDADGTLTSCTFQCGGLTLTSPCVAWEDGFFFTLCPGGELAGELDAGGIPGGWGLYWLDGAGRTVETRWSLPAGERPAGLLDGEQTWFFLSRDERAAYLYLLERDSLDPLGRVELFPLDSGEEPPACWLDLESRLLVLASGRHMAVLSLDCAGTWRHAFTVELEEQEALGMSLARDISQNRVSMAFDGARLAFSASAGGGEWDFCAAVYSAAGLEFLGGYRSSLGRSASVQLDFWGETLYPDVFTPADFPPCFVSWAE